MKLISTVTHRGEHDAVLAVLEDGGSFLAPVFDAEGELIAYYEGDMEKLGELVREFVTGTAPPGSVLQSAAVPCGESHSPDRIPSSGSGNPKGEVPCSDSHPPAKIDPSRSGNPRGVSDEILLALSEFTRACVARLKVAAHDALADASASSRKEMKAQPA